MHSIHFGDYFYSEVFTEPSSDLQLHCLDGSGSKQLSGKPADNHPRVILHVSGGAILWLSQLSIML